MKYNRQKGQTRRKALYFSWIEKNTEKNTPPSKGREVENSQQN